MNSKNIIDLYKNPNNNTISEKQRQNLNYLNLVPSISNPIQNQQCKAKIQITTKESFTALNAIYLPVIDKHNINEAAKKCDYNNPKKKKINL